MEAKKKLIDIKNPIIGVAFQSKNKKHLLSMLKPKRHCDIFYFLHENMKGRFNHSWWTQGFITLSGEFLTRSEAAEYALKIGQATPEYQGELFSEDLW